jgi:hypothetical protein
VWRKCTNVKRGGTYLPEDFYNIFIKLSQQLMWAGLWAARVKIKVSGIPNRIIYFVQTFYSNYIILKCGRGPQVGHPFLTVTAELVMVRNIHSDVFTTENLLRVHPPASAYSALNGSHKASHGRNVYSYVECIPGYLITLNLQNLISIPVIHLPYLCAEYLSKN